MYINLIARPLLGVSLNEIKTALNKVTTMKTIIRLIPTLILAVHIATADEWPAYRGAAGDGICTEKLNLNWSAVGPRVVWRVPTPNGFSSFAVGEGKAFTQVIREINGAPREICLALDAATGKELWAADVAIGKGYSGGGEGDGPRSTPTVNGGKVYAFTPDSVLHCLDAATGKPVWKKNIIGEFAGRNIGWNFAASPVVDGDLLFVAGGGSGQSLLAFNKKTGDVVWKTGDETTTHAMPVVATILGERQVIFFCKSGLVAVAEKDGRPLWKFPCQFKTAIAASPVVCGDIVFCTVGYGIGGGACKIAKSGNNFTATALYENKGSLASLWSTPLFKEGFIYGVISFKKPGTGPLKCFESATGKICWEQSGYGDGQAILIGDKVLALTDKGDLVVVAAAPSGYKELRRFKAVTGKCWSTPAVSNGRIFVRSTKEGVCLDSK
ncbi:MAG: PQQ-binding-like beta-propeller repeat protein [Kiritimatiellaeota bacterium]|nr:PQQ-binding-like beta-propeller repeat protein [Kiritimatiellota bacterium]